MIGNFGMNWTRNGVKEGREGEEMNNFEKQGAWKIIYKVKLGDSSTFCWACRWLSDLCFIIYFVAPICHLRHLLFPSLDFDGLLYLCLHLGLAELHQLLLLPLSPPLLRVAWPQSQSPPAPNHQTPYQCWLGDCFWCELRSFIIMGVASSQALQECLLYLESLSTTVDPGMSIIPSETKEPPRKSIRNSKPLIWTSGDICPTIPIRAPVMSNVQFPIMFLTNIFQIAIDILLLQIHPSKNQIIFKRQLKMQNG